MIIQPVLNYVRINEQRILSYGFKAIGPRPMFFSKKFIIDKSKVPILKEDDLEEKFMGGGGPGGQSVAKTRNACQLRHIPTGLYVKNHFTRSLEQNRKLARLSLINKLDTHFNGDQSVAAQKEKILKEKSIKNASKARKKLEIKKRWKELEATVNEL